MNPLPDDLAAFDAFLRIEPRSRSESLREGVKARVADPLWMLTRQWQTGELLGEDAGSPLRVELEVETQTTDHIQLGDDPARVLPTDVPLETLVERERGVLDHRERVRIGQEYERRLRALLTDRGDESEYPTVLAGLRADHAFPSGASEEHLDHATRRFVRSMTGRVLDGEAVLQAPLSPVQGVSEPELDTLHQAIETWFGTVCHRPPTAHPPAWRPSNLDFGFSLNPPVDQTPARTHLVAPRYRNGTVDWHAFSAQGASQGTWHTAGPLVSTPTRIEISGTSTRWWAFEDAQTDFGAIEVSTPDLARLLFMEFVLLYGDDWFSVPAPVRLGSLAAVSQLRVWNVFGEVTDVCPARSVSGTEPATRFDLFGLSPADDPTQPAIGRLPTSFCSSPAAVLYVPRAVPARRESRPLEEVVFLRDEGANMVWAIENTVQNGIGKPVRGADAQRERRARQRLAAPAPVPDPPQTDARYQLATTVPAHWIPFIPTRRGMQGDRPRMQLRRAQMLVNTADDDPVPIPSMSRLLAMQTHPLLFVEEHAVPRAGLRVQLTKHRARWTDGSTHVWLGRKVLTGRGEGASGLRFDVVES